MLPGPHDQPQSTRSIQVIVGIGPRPKPDTFTFVDADPLDHTRRFVSTLSTSYHRYKLRTFTADLDSPDDKPAYLALRHTLGELLEVTAATAVAAIQAPVALPVWLIRYQNRHLDSCVDALLADQALPSADAAGGPQERTYSYLIEEMSAGHPELRDALDAAGRHIFTSYRDKPMRDEYNALKHGNRVNTAPFQCQTQLADMDWQRTLIFEQLHEIQTQGLTGYVLQWRIHPVELVSLYAQIDLCLRWLDVLHWALRWLHDVDTVTPHPGFPSLDNVTSVWDSRDWSMVITQQVTSGGRVLDDGHRTNSAPLHAEQSLPSGITRRST